MLRASATPKPRLLIGENDPATRAALATQLSDRFEVVAQARDAQEAITLVELYGPDVALLEVHMPAGGGIHATREICRLQTQHGSLCFPTSRFVARVVRRALLPAA